MDVTHNFNRRFKFQKYWLVGKYILGGQAQIDDVLLSYFDVIRAFWLFGIDSNFLVLFKVTKSRDDLVGY